MEKKPLAIGRIQNGVMTINGEVVKTYSRPVVAPVVEEMTMETRTVPAHEVPRDIRKHAMAGTVQPLLKMIEKKGEIDVPSFMKSREPMGQVLQFKKKGEEPKEKEVTAEDIADAFEDIVNHIGKKIKKFIKPVAKHIFDVYEEDER